MAIFAAATLLDQDMTDILSAMSEVKPVDGRFETLISPEGIIAIVDYAHTPDAVKNVLTTINSIRTHNEKLLTVIGAGGNRDTTKRPVMAQIAARLSERVILTSDNPRSEKPEDIIDQMRAGVDPVDFKKVLTITNRREAIIAACAMAQPGDIILVAGKGHEKYQEIQGVKHHFDDKEILCETLNIIEK
jgi:UDP-N-acetylmuramoyl-L-alanyl-D-glutamate--2,6-diaminopimelate ligase